MHRRAIRHPRQRAAPRSLSCPVNRAAGAQAGRGGDWGRGAGGAEKAAGADRTAARRVRQKTGSGRASQDPAGAGRRSGRRGGSLRNTQHTKRGGGPIADGRSRPCSSGAALRRGAATRRHGRWGGAAAAGAATQGRGRGRDTRPGPGRAEADCRARAARSRSGLRSQGGGREQGEMRVAETLRGPRGRRPRQRSACSTRAPGPRRSGHLSSRGPGPDKPGPAGQDLGAEAPVPGAAGRRSSRSFGRRAPEAGNLAEST